MNICGLTMWRPQYTVCVVVITGGQSSNKVEPSLVIVMLLSVYTHLTIGDPVTWYRVFWGEIDELCLCELTNLYHMTLVEFNHFNGR